MKIFILQLLLCSVSMTFVSVLYCAVSKLLSRVQSARWRYYGWIFIGIGFLTPFKPCFGEPLIELNIDQLSDRVLSQYNGLSYSGNGSFAAAQNADIPDIWQLAFILWLTGMFLFLANSFVRQMLFRRSVKRLSFETDRETVQIIDELCWEMNIRRKVHVRCMSVISTPMLTGIFRPCILLPVHNFSHEELRLVLKHELIHFRHGDLYMKLFIIICHAVHWFNPFLPFLFHYAEQECELACDEKVMEGEDTESAGIYCRSILKTAENRFRLNFSLPSVSTNFYSGKHSLQKRMKSILSNKKKYPMRIICFLVCAATLATGTLAAYAETEQAARFIRDSIIVNDVPDETEEQQPTEEIELSEEYESSVTTSETENPAYTTAMTGSVQDILKTSSITPESSYDKPIFTAATTAPSEDRPAETTFVTTVSVTESETVVTTAVTVSSAETTATDAASETIETVTSTTSSSVSTRPTLTTTTPAPTESSILTTTTTTMMTTAMTTTDATVSGTDTTTLTTTANITTHTTTSDPYHTTFTTITYITTHTTTSDTYQTTFTTATDITTHPTTIAPYYTTYTTTTTVFMDD